MVRLDERPYDEFSLISALTERLPEAGADVRVGIGDDAAVLIAHAGEDALVTTDTMVEGVHFRTETMHFSDVGYKCLAASVSDIAAMGGRPTVATLSLAIPAKTALGKLEQLYDGVAEAAREYNVSVVGGDVVSTTGPLVLTSTVIGRVSVGLAMLRSAATVGDIVFVTGDLGRSAAGLHTLLHPSPLFRPEELGYAQAKHQRPTARVDMGQWLSGLGVRTCNDVSDGLASELNEIAHASKVRLRVHLSQVPLHPSTRRIARLAGIDELDFALYGGEDYELVGTAPPHVFANALAVADAMTCKVTAIGRVEAGDGVVGVWPDGHLDVVKPRGFNHFVAEERGV
ncbi:MAG: thiamine-phosphate kinase [Alicyclobacillaceae bacterium]|nr:thiamine-phosphate kinase [Alicyclobacillaceae bacterium]